MIGTPSVVTIRPVFTLIKKSHNKFRNHASNMSCVIVIKITQVIRYISEIHVLNELVRIWFVVA